MLRVLLLGSAVVGIWGSAWVVVRAAIHQQHLSPEGLALGRNLVASLTFALVLLWRRPPRLQRSEQFRLLLAGVIGIALYTLLAGWGQRSVDAGTAAVIIQSAPVWTALGAWGLAGQRISGATWLGMVMAVAGLALIGLGGRAGSGGTLPDLAMLFAASLAFSAYSLWTQPVAARIGGWWPSAFAVWIGTLALLPWSGDALADLRGQPRNALAVWLFLGVLSTAAAYAAWTALTGLLPLARAAVFLYLIPVLALALGWAILGEHPGALGLAGVGCILAGVVVAQRKKPCTAR
jgi:drug/metabolite transporter (DMT)-like permease